MKEAVKEEKVWTPLDKLNYIKKYLDDKVPDIASTIQYKVLLTAMKKLIADSSYIPSDFEMTSVNSLYIGYDIPSPVKTEQFNGIDEVLTVDDFKSAQFAFTGFRSEELRKELVMKHGALPTGNVGTSTTLLIAKDPSKNSAKIRKAEDVGAKVVSLKDVTNFLKPNDPNKVWR